MRVEMYFPSRSRYPNVFTTRARARSRVSRSIGSKNHVGCKCETAGFTRAIPRLDTASFDEIILQVFAVACVRAACVFGLCVRDPNPIVEHARLIARREMDTV